MDFSSDGLALSGHSVHLREESGLLARDRRLVTIDELPDNVLVEIFFYANIKDSEIHNPWHIQIYNPWHTLIHVCRRWRYLVFASPRRLNLRLEYGGDRPMSEALDTWPVLPISLTVNSGLTYKRRKNTVAALESEHYNRICEIYIWIIHPEWERFTAAMQRPFPELTDLEVSRVELVPVPILPESFLGGSAPRLRSLMLTGIPFPSIPKLLLSAHRLVTLSLSRIVDSGYFSPDALATSLTVMTKLESLSLRFFSPPSRPDTESRPLPPPTRFVLPALTKLVSSGVREYLEDLLARVDAPLLGDLSIDFFMDLDFDVPQLHRFIGNVEGFKTFDRASVSISDYSIRLHVSSNRGSVDDRAQLKLLIKCPKLDRQLSSLAQVCNRSFPFIFALEDLQIGKDDGFCLKDKMENAPWLELLEPFTALRNLYLADGITQRFCRALQELSRERATEVLPALRNLFVRGVLLGHVQEAIKPLVAARQPSGHPVVVDYWCG